MNDVITNCFLYIAVLIIHSSVFIKTFYSGRYFISKVFSVFFIRLTHWKQHIKNWDLSTIINFFHINYFSVVGTYSVINDSCLVYGNLIISLLITSIYFFLRYSWHTSEVSKHFISHWYIFREMSCHIELMNEHVENSSASKEDRWGKSRHSIDPPFPN